jgi:hypothetical protein
VFKTEGVRHAVGVCQPDMRQLGFVVEDPDDHPFNLGPIALLDRGDVTDLRDALTEWLDA